MSLQEPDVLKGLPFVLFPIVLCVHIQLPKGSATNEKSISNMLRGRSIRQFILYIMLYIVCMWLYVYFVYSAKAMWQLVNNSLFHEYLRKGLMLYSFTKLKLKTHLITAQFIASSVDNIININNFIMIIHPRVF